MLHPKHYREILAVLDRNLPDGGTVRLITALTRTEAYERNKSFRETVEGLRLTEKDEQRRAGLKVGT